MTGIVLTAVYLFAITGNWPVVFGLVVLPLIAVSGTAAMLLSIWHTLGARMPAAWFPDSTGDGGNTA